MEKSNHNWASKREKEAQRLEKISNLLNGKYAETEKIVEVVEKLIISGDRIVLEGDNQKRASFLSESLEKIDAEKVNDPHLITSSISRPGHLNIFEKGTAGKIDSSYAGAQGLRVAQMIEDGTMKLGDTHTYPELYGRLFVDLIPDVVLVVADKVDKDDNLYTSFDTEETPTIVEAAAFKDGIVTVQVNEVVDKLPRVDIPGDWVDVVIKADQPHQLEALFTCGPQNITELQILMAVMAIKGIYTEHDVQSLSHSIGFNTAAIELLLPTYGESLGLRGKIAENWALNPYPAMIPAIESGWVENIHSSGGEVGMEKYVAARPDVLFVGKDGMMRSNRTLSQTAGQYAIDMFTGSALQLNYEGNSSIVTKGCLSGFGGASNMGHNPGGRRHSTPAWQSFRNNSDPLGKGQKLVVQMVETYGSNKKPVFTEESDVLAVQKQVGLANASVMTYSEDTTCIMTEEGIAYLHKAKAKEERQVAIAATSGVTPLGMISTKESLDRLRDAGIAKLPEGLGIKRSEAKYSLSAAQTIDDLIEWSDGLHEPPMKFRTWS